MISKSTFMSGLQCRKLLWYRVNARDQIPPVDAATQAVFDQGHEVGKLAKGLFDDGLDIEGEHRDFDSLVEQTQQALHLRRPLFEAAFSHGGGFARADVLNPVDDDAWDLYEVKSTTEVKDVHIPDLTFQAWVYQGSGLNLRRCFLLHINNGFVRQGSVAPESFFTKVDLTPQVTTLSRSIETQLDDMLSLARRPQCPGVQIGPHCDSPYQCRLHDHCWSFLPDQNVTALYRGKQKGFDLLREGITRIADIPNSTALTSNQEIQRQAALTGTPHVEVPPLQAFLQTPQYPLYFLDFETFGTAIPLFDGTRPYEQVPFQFSLHIVGSPGEQPEHHSFLAEGREDPRRPLLDRLRILLGKEGSIVAYNAQFEIGVLERCCAIFGGLDAWLNAIKVRIVDLLIPFRAFRYYHPAQLGSASMKAVLPALTGTSYSDLAIQDGSAASREFLRVTFGDVSPDERTRVRRDLEAYCGQDTLGMVDILQSLKRLVH